MSLVHPSVILGKNVELAPDVKIGPFTCIQGQVKIGSGTVIDSHVSIGNENGIVEIGKNNHILSSAMVGGIPQDVSYKGETTKLVIGDNNMIREFTTLNCGTMKEGGVTRIGSGCMLMAYVHVAHDCQIGNHVIVANSTQFAGHVRVEDYARIGGMVGIAQFARIGTHAYIGGGATINKDILPYSIAEGNWARVRAVNKVGMSRAGFSKEDIDNIYKAMRFIIMGDRTMEEALEKIGTECDSTAQVQHLVQFIKSSENGIAR